MIRRAVVRWESCPGWLPPPHSEARCPDRVFVDSPDRLREATGSLGRDDQAIDPVLHDLGTPPTGVTITGSPAAIADRSAMGKPSTGREGECIHRAEQIGKVATRSKEEDGIPDTLPHRLLTEPILLPPAPDECQCHPLSLPAQPPDRFDQVLLPFLLFETPHGSGR